LKARPDAIGQPITVNGVPYTVVGVMPPGFEFPAQAGAWTTMQLDPLSNRGNHSWQVMGRLKPGATVEHATGDLVRIASGLETLYPSSNTGWSAEVKSLREFQAGDFRPMLIIMTASVAFVLLIACANVANLLLARAAVRQKEMAVRVALGADSWRVVRQLLTESVLVALVGAALGIAFAYAFLQWIKASILGGIPFWMKFTIDGEVLAFTVAIAAVTGLLFGLVPALQSARPNLNETLRDAGARGSSAGRARQRLRSGLVVGEVALSLVLLVGAALLIRSFLGMQNVKPGFDPSHLLTMRFTMQGPAYDSMYKRFNALDRLLERSTRLPESSPHRSRTTFRSVEATTTASFCRRHTTSSSGPSRCSRSAGFRRAISRRCAFRCSPGACSPSRNGRTAAWSGVWPSSIDIRRKSSGNRHRTRWVSGSNSARRTTRRTVGSRSWASPKTSSTNSSHRRRPTFRGTCHIARADGARRQSWSGHWANRPR